MNDMTPHDATDLSLTVSRRIAAPPARVYEAWLDPQKLTRFMANCDGMALSAAEIDPRVGGRFLMTMQSSPQSGNTVGVCETMRAETSAS